MAITFQKQPLNFFNVNEPAIFEFSSDADLGVNPNDLVADLELKSLWTNRRYVIKNILPNYNTGVFRVDVQGYLKSLMLDNFDYRFENPNKQYTIENFSIGVSVHAENTSDTLGDAYVFDSGYIFDETFVFAEEVPSDNDVNTGFYPIIGITHFSEVAKVQNDTAKLNFLSPKYVEFCEGFINTISVFVGNLAATDRTLTVEGSNSIIPSGKGVSTAIVNDAQINKMYLPTLLTTSLNNTNIPVYGINYKDGYCEETLQFRFYNSYGGYSYFFTSKEALSAARSKTEFVNNAFYNQQENRSSEVQRSVDYSESMNLTGVKNTLLQESFRDFLRSPKIEILLNGVFRECKVSGQFNLRKLDFEYTLNVDIANANQMTL